MTSTPVKTNIAICDDHPIVRHAIKTIVETSNKYIVCAEACDCESTLKALSSHKIEILIMDLSLPGKSGIETIYQARALHYNNKVIVLSMHDDDARVKQSYQAGANAFLSKDSTPKSILNALDIVASGEDFVPARFDHLKGWISKCRLPDGIAGKKDLLKDCATERPLDKLSKREREVFYLLVDGKPNRVIAKQLFLSPRTVETHRARLIKKLGLNSTADLVRYAIKNHLHSLS